MTHMSHSSSGRAAVSQMVALRGGRFDPCAARMSTRLLIGRRGLLL